MAIVTGSTGNDTLDGGTSVNDTYNAGLGNDTVVATNGFDLINAGLASSAAYWRSGGTAIDAGDFVSYANLWTQNGHASAGDVKIVVDLALGTVVKSDIFGALGTDTLVGVDSIIATGGADALSGRNFWDFEDFRGAAGNDTIDGRGGYDGAVYSDATAAITVNLAAGTVSGNASVGSDTLRQIEFITGSAFADSYNASGYGGSSVNENSFGEGFNVFTAGAGNDSVTGNGQTVLNYGNAGGSLVVNLGLQTAAGVQANVITNALSGSFTGVAPGNDVVSGVYGIRGSNFADTLTGGGHVNTLVVGSTVSGDRSVELFRGNGGNDSINGSTGFDRADYNVMGQSSGITVNLAAGTVIGDAVVTGTDTIRGVESVTGSYLDDVYNATGFTLSNAAAPSVNRGDVIATPPAGETLASSAFNEFRPLAGDDQITGNGATRVSFQNMLVEHLSGSLPSVSVSFTGAASGSGSYGQTDGGFGSVAFTGTFAIRGGAGNDSVVGATGYQLFEGYFGNDTLNGGDGNDVLVGHQRGGADADLNPTAIFSDNDSLLGGAGNDALEGNFGNDVLNGGSGVDTMNGGTGSDTYYVDSASDQTLETVAGTNGGSDLVYSTVSLTLGSNLERLTLTGAAAISGTGNTLANTLTGNGAANTLSGSSGNDTLNGAAGNDVLLGGAGNDSLIGGTGADFFRFNVALSGTTNVDRLADFVAVDDRIDLDDAVFAGVGAAGALSAAAFRAGAAAADASDRVIYNASTGQLLYDADGSGAGAAILFATVAAGTAITVADFFVV